MTLVALFQRVCVVSWAKKCAEILNFCTDKIFVLCPSLRLSEYVTRSALVSLHLVIQKWLNLASPNLRHPVLDWFRVCRNMSSYRPVGHPGCPVKRTMLIVWVEMFGRFWYQFVQVVLELRRKMLFMCLLLVSIFLFYIINEPKYC